MNHEHFPVTNEMSLAVRTMLVGVTNCDTKMMDVAYSHLRKLVMDVIIESEIKVNELFEGNHDA